MPFWNSIFWNNTRRTFETVNYFLFVAVIALACAKVLENWGRHLSYTYSFIRSWRFRIVLTMKTFWQQLQRFCIRRSSESRRYLWLCMVHSVWVQADWLSFLAKIHLSVLLIYVRMGKPSRLKGSIIGRLIAFDMQGERRYSQAV
jgi:hypothetical protein